MTSFQSEEVGSKGKNWLAALFSVIVVIVQLRWMWAEMRMIDERMRVGGKSRRRRRKRKKVDEDWREQREPPTDLGVSESETSTALLTSPLLFYKELSKILADSNRESLVIVKISRGLKPNEERSFERSLPFDNPALSRIVSQQLVYYVVILDEKRSIQQKKQGDLQVLLLSTLFPTPPFFPLSF